MQRKSLGTARASPAQTVREKVAAKAPALRLQHVLAYGVVSYALTWMLVAGRRWIGRTKGSRRPVMQKRSKTWWLPSTSNGDKYVYAAAVDVVRLVAQCTKPQSCAHAVERAAPVPLPPIDDRAYLSNAEWASGIDADFFESFVDKDRHLTASIAESQREAPPKRSFEVEVAEAVAATIGSSVGAMEVMFTVLDESYADMLSEVKAAAERMKGALFYVSLHSGTAVAARRLGCRVALLESKSMSKKQLVYMGKYYTAMLLCSAGVRFFFFEMDVWFPSRGQRTALDVFRAAVSPQATGIARVSATWALHTDNPYQINAGLYYVRPEVSSAPYYMFAALLDYSRRHQHVFDQGLLNCVLKRAASNASRELTFIRDRDNCADSEIDLADPSLSFVLDSTYFFNWTLVDAAAIASYSTPFVASDTLAVHILTSRPLSSSAGKKVVAKELMLWEGAADCYYCLGGSGRRFIALDGPLTSLDGKDDWYLIKHILADLVAVARLSDRALVLPSVSHYGRRFPSWEVLDTKSLLGPMWRETTFLHNPKLNVFENAKIARIALVGDAVCIQPLAGPYSASTRAVQWYRKPVLSDLEAAVAAALKHPIANQADLLLVSLAPNRGRLIHAQEVLFRGGPRDAWVERLLRGKLTLCSYVHREKRKAAQIAAHMDCGTQISTARAKRENHAATAKGRLQSQDSNSVDFAVSYDASSNAEGVQHTLSSTMRRHNVSRAFATDLRARLATGNYPSDWLAELETSKDRAFGPVPHPLSRFLYQGWSIDDDVAVHNPPSGQLVKTWE